MAKKEIEKYSGQLPEHVIAQLQEHSAGGFLIFRVDVEGDVVSDLRFDNEVYYLALVRKATTILTALNAIDNNEAIQQLSYSPFEGEEQLEEEDDEDEDDE